METVPRWLAIPRCCLLWDPSVRILASGCRLGWAGPCARPVLIFMKLLSGLQQLVDSWPPSAHCSSTFNDGIGLLIKRCDRLLPCPMLQRRSKAPGCRWDPAKTSGHEMAVLMSGHLGDPFQSSRVVLSVREGRTHLHYGGQRPE